MKKEILTYEDLLTVEDANYINGTTSDEEMVSINDASEIIIHDHGFRFSEELFFQVKPPEDMQPYTGNDIFLRENALSKLVSVARNLKAYSLRLLVVYGYRHPDLQQKYFTEILEKLSGENKNLSEKELYSLAHNFIAVPEVAGHTTGGAVDVTLVGKSGKELDMGTNIYDFSDPQKIITFTKKVTAEQIKNRMLLRIAMEYAGFVPFNGEWWHFSFGDKEWAFWNAGWNSYSHSAFGHGPTQTSLLPQAKYKQIYFTTKK